MRECERDVNIRTWRKKRKLISTLDSVRERRRGYILFFCVLGLIAIFASRPTGIPLYEARIDERAFPAIAAALEEEGLSFSLRGGRMTVPPDELSQARTVLYRKGLPDFPPLPDEMDSRSGPEWIERMKRAESSTEFALYVLPGVRDFRVSYGCGKCHYARFENHTCDRVWVRMLVGSSFKMTEEERLGLLSFLAHSLSGLQVAGFSIIDENSPDKVSYCRLDLRQVSGKLKVEDCEFACD